MKRKQGEAAGAAVLLAMVLALSLGWRRTWADEERQLIPVGKAVGIKLLPTVYWWYPCRRCRERRRLAPGQGVRPERGRYPADLQW